MENVKKNFGFVSPSVTTQIGFDSTETRRKNSHAWAVSTFNVCQHLGDIPNRNQYLCSAMYSQMQGTDIYST